MLTVSAFFFAVLGIAAAERAGERLMTGHPHPEAPAAAKGCRFLAVVFIALAIACAVSGASH